MSTDIQIIDAAYLRNFERKEMSQIDRYVDEIIAKVIAVSKRAYPASNTERIVKYGIDSIHEPLYDHIPGFKDRLICINIPDSYFPITMDKFTEKVTNKVSLQIEKVIELLKTKFALDIDIYCEYEFKTNNGISKSLKISGNRFVDNDNISTLMYELKKIDVLNIYIVVSW
jgi:hypothetical protein